MLRQMVWTVLADPLEVVNRSLLPEFAELPDDNLA